MIIQTTLPQRRDGKYKVNIIYKGGANMFGGFYPSKVFKKLLTTEQLTEYWNSPTLEKEDSLFPREITSG